VLPPARADRNGQDDDAGAPDVGKNHDLADSSVPVTTTNHLTQQPHVKNQNSQTLTHAARRPTGNPLQKPTVVQWDIGAMPNADGAADESVSPQSGITPAFTRSHRLVATSPISSRPPHI